MIRTLSTCGLLGALAWPRLNCRLEMNLPSSDCSLASPSGSHGTVTQRGKRQCSTSSSHGLQFESPPIACYSAIDKKEHKILEVTEDGHVSGDQPANQEYHGGPERALLHYSTIGYRWLRTEFARRGKAQGARCVDFGRLQAPGFGNSTRI